VFAAGLTLDCVYIDPFSRGGLTTHISILVFTAQGENKIKMRIPQSYIQKCKVVGHVFQSIFIFVGLCITIAVFTKDGETGGATRYYLALVR
jgi:hypothetical protein